MSSLFKCFSRVFALVIVICFSTFPGVSQMGIGTNTPDSSAVLDLVSTSRGFLPPRMNTTQILAIPKPAAGLMAYNTSYNLPVFFNGSEWKFFCSGRTLTDAALDSGLVAYYPFNNNFNDESGNGNHGTVPAAGGSLTTDKDGKTDAAFNCNGNGQKLIAQNNGSLVFGSALSVSFNVMTRGSGRFPFVSMVENLTGSGANFSIGTLHPYSNQLVFSVVDVDTVCHTPHGYSQASNAEGPAIVTNTWYNIICTFDRGTMKVYLNGVLAASKAARFPQLKQCTNRQLLIGGWWHQDPQASLNGKIDEVRLYNRVLTTNEVKELSYDFR